MPGLVERERERERIASRLDRAVGGHGGAVVVLGPAGEGKTALARAVAEDAAGRDFTVLTVTADQLGIRSPFGLARRLLDQALMGLDPAERQALADGPAWLAVEHLLRTTAVEHGDLMASLDWLVAGLADHGPLLLVADDVQWADEESLLFLASLRHRLAALPVLLLVAAREVSPEDRRPALAALVADRDAEVLRLDPLSEAGVGRLLRRVWGEADPETTRAVGEVTGGNPFLVLAVAHLLSGTGRVTAQAVRDAVPGSVIDSVVARIAGLGDAERDLARAVAALERTTTGVAAELTGLDLATAAAAADRLRAAGLFGVGSRLGYRHALLRSAVYAATGADAREQLHRAAARLLAATDIRAAAAHLMETTGTNDSWAVEVLCQAAALALDRGAPHTAVALLRRAVAEPPSADETAAVLLQLGLGEMRTLDAQCVVTLAEAEQALIDPGDRARCALALAEAYSYAGFHEPAAEVLERALDVVADDPDAALELEAALIATGLLLGDRIADARRRLHARPGLSGATRAERLFLNQQLSNAVGTNQPAPLIRDLARRALHPDDSPERTEWVWARLFLVAIGDYEHARRLADDGFTTAAANGSVVGFVTASYVGGLIELVSGSLPAAEEHFRAMLDHGEPISPGPLVSLLGRGELAQTLTLQGRVDDALALLADFPEQPPAEWPMNGVATLHYARAVVRHAAGDHAGALASARSLGALLIGLDVDSPTWASWRSVAIPPLRALGSDDEARALAEENVELCERSDVPVLLGEALRLLGELDAGQLAPLERAVAVLTGAQSLLGEGLARLSLGSALRRTGHRARARDELLVARAHLATCGATPWFEHANAELAAAGSRTARVDLTGAGALTASERRVADLAAEGRTNTEIARTLFVSPKTVETHLTRAYRKLGITGRAELPDLLTP